MILAYAVILLVVIAWLLRRDLGALGRIQYRGGWKLAGLVAAIFVMQSFLVVYADQRTEVQMTLLILSQSALVALCLINHHLPGAKMFALGVLLNTLVMVANGGWMPITPETYQFVHSDQTLVVETRTKPVKSKNVILPRDETNLWILSDMIPLALPGRRSAFSVGDLLLVGGIAQFIFQITSRATGQTPKWSGG